MLDDYSMAGAPAESNLDGCRAYMDYQVRNPKRPSDKGIWPPPGPAVTISAQTGVAVEELARQLAAELENREPPGHAPWTVFNRQLVEIALEQHHLPGRLAKFMPEDRRSYFDDVVDEMMGLRPPSWELIPKIIQSVQHLADAGHVILVGRGAGVAIGNMANVFHVRLVASLANRIARVQELEKLSSSEAAKFIAKSDRGRERYVKANFRKRADDDLNYHLVLNTDRVPLADAVELIADGAQRCFRSDTLADEQRVAA
jgi:hypothetical protein